MKHLNENEINSVVLGTAGKKLVVKAELHTRNCTECSSKIAAMKRILTPNSMYAGGPGPSDEIRKTVIHRWHLEAAKNMDNREKITFSKMLLKYAAPVFVIILVSAGILLYPLFRKDNSSTVPAMLTENNIAVYDMIHGTRVERVFKNNEVISTGLKFYSEIYDTDSFRMTIFHDSEISYSFEHEKNELAVNLMHGILLSRSADCHNYAVYCSGYTIRPEGTEYMVFSDGKNIVAVVKNGSIKITENNTSFSILVNEGTSWSSGFPGSTSISTPEIMNIFISGITPESSIRAIKLLSVQAKPQKKYSKTQKGSDSTSLPEPEKKDHEVQSTNRYTGNGGSNGNTSSGQNQSGNSRKAGRK